MQSQTISQRITPAVPQTELDSSSSLASPPSPSLAAARSLPELPPEKDVYRHVAQYAQASWSRAWFELAVVCVSYVLMMWTGWWGFFPLLSLFRIKMFVIFHDLAHNNFFPSTLANKVVGTLLGCTMLMSYVGWQRDHNYHHKHSNNLERKQYSQTAPWTVDQYNKAPTWMKVAYEIIYHPVAILTIVPILFFYVVQRIVGAWYETLLSLIHLAIMYYLGGFDLIWLDWAPGITGGAFGVFLFHLQHTFPGAVRKRPPHWSYYENGMRASSFLQLPAFLKYFTFGIEYHHIHHLNAKVPGYRLQECHEAGGDLFAGVPKVSLWDGLRSLAYNKYDEKIDKFVS